MLQCWIGQRFSDLGLKDAIVTENKITLTQKKTKQRVTLPILPVVREILEKYNYKLPEFSASFTNERLKVIAEAAGINQEVQVSEHRDKVRTFKMKKYELITSHTARPRT